MKSSLRGYALPFCMLLASTGAGCSEDAAPGVDPSGAKTGGTAQMLAPISPDHVVFPTLLDAANVYYADDDGGAAGAVPTVLVTSKSIELATALGDPASPAVDDRYVYWFNNGSYLEGGQSKHDGQLMRMAEEGSLYRSMRSLLVVAVAAVVSLATVAACSSPELSSNFASSKKSNDAGAGDPGNLLGSGDPGATGPTARPSDCSEAATFVYVVSAENDLYRFDPAKLVFTKIGPLACPASSGATPFSMAVDRTGTAWVDYTDGSLFRVSTTDASCHRTGYVASQGFSTFGMGFSTNQGDPTHESLFVIGCDLQSETSAGLGRIDTTSFALAPVGTLGAAENGKCGELTGTGDGRLYGLFDSAPALFATIASTTGTASADKTLPGVVTRNSAYAFSFWGGDLWFYTALDGVGGAPGASSKVTRYKAASDGSVTDVLTDIGFTIVGAGVSTCAPTTPVK